MKKTLLFTLMLCLSAPAWIQAQWGGPQSKVENKAIHSDVLNAERQYTIYLPKSYDVEKDRKYPILYLLHGMGGINTSWFENERAKDVMDLLVASGEACEMIIVSPNAGGEVSKDWNGYFDMPGWSYETFFFEEFVPHIEGTYRVIGDKQHRAIAGLSMGGGGTTGYAQRHSDMFCAAYAMSALMTIPNLGAQPPQNPEDKLAILTKSVIEHSCVDYVANATEEQKNQLRTVAWFVDCGDDDFLLDTNIDFTREMRKAGIPFEFRVRDGGHTSEYWHTALYYCLPFVTRNFK